MLKTVIVFDSVGLDIPDYVMTNDDGGRRPAGSFSPSFFLFSFFIYCQQEVLVTLRTWSPS